MQLQIAAASGNVFGYLWADEVPASFAGPLWARRLCPRGSGFGLDGLFLLQRPGTGPWEMEHWDSDGSHSFCSNGTRAALAVTGAPPADSLEVRSSGETVRLRRDAHGIGIRMPEGPGFGLRPVPIELPQPSGVGFVGNPQLVMLMAHIAEVDLALVARPLRYHIAFPEGTNVNLVEPLGPGEARIRSFERGVEGETLCCGTGCAVAAAWLARREGTTQWKLHTAGGEPVSVSLVLDGDQWRELWLSGPVRRLGQLEPDSSLLG